MIVRVKLVHPDAKLPEYKTDGAAGADLHSIEDVTIHPGRAILARTGISIELESGFEAQIRPRSGLAVNKGVTVLNSPGTIDSDYRDEIRVLLILLGNIPVTLPAGSRIAQIVVAPVVRSEFQIVDELSTTARGKGGFGSTGM